jgi:twinkle protein
MEALGVTDYDDQNHRSLCAFHVEDTPSFIYNSKAYNVHCFGCGRTVDLIDAYMHTGLTYLQSVQKMFELARVQYAFGEMGVKTKQQYYYPKPVYAENNDRVYEYLAKRAISQKTAEYLNLMQDTHGDILIQYYDLNDVLTMVKCRKSQPVPHGELKCWYLTDADHCKDKRDAKPYGTTPILYNMNKVNYDNPLLITSGELDCAAAIEAGYLNTVSIPMGDQNTHWVKECFDFLEKFNTIIIVPDNDESGMKYCKDIIPRIGSWKCKVAVVPDVYEDVEGKKHRVKDINDCLYYFGKEKVIEVILNAKDTPVPSVKNLSEVKRRSFNERDGILTGIEVIDKELLKIPYGTLTILSGMPGAGKSSLICQMICNVLDQDINCWLFSGELPEDMNKDWFTYIFAGPRNVVPYQTPLGDTYYNIPPDIEKKIDDHYDYRWFIYQDDQDNDLDSLIRSMTDVVRKYNVRFLVLDNMMVIDTAETDNELREQTKTIKKLIAFSKKYNVATVLVAHPRKLSNTSTVGMYDISGTANIANLAHRTIGMRKVTPEEKDGSDRESKLKKELRKYDVVVNIIKDRMRGRSNINRGLYYDVASRRFFGSPEEYSHQYKWDKTVYKNELPYPIIDETEEVFGKINNE